MQTKYFPLPVIEIKLFFFLFKVQWGGFSYTLNIERAASSCIDSCGGCVRRKQDSPTPTPTPCLPQIPFPMQQEKEMDFAFLLFVMVVLPSTSPKGRVKNSSPTLVSLSFAARCWTQRDALADCKSCFGRGQYLLIRCLYYI